MTDNSRPDPVSAAAPLARGPFTKPVRIAHLWGLMLTFDVENELKLYIYLNMYGFNVKRSNIYDNPSPVFPLHSSHLLLHFFLKVSSKTQSPGARSYFQVVQPFVARPLIACPARDGELNVFPLYKMDPSFLTIALYNLPLYLCRISNLLLT